MNCQSFESAISDLARDQMMEAQERRRALAHAEACERCGARLGDERALSAGLRKMAESRDEAPEAVEASLREAFGAWIATHHEPIMVAVPLWPRLLRWAGAAAAILVVALLAMTAMRSRTAETPDARERASQEKEALPSSVSRPADPQPEATPAALSAIGTGKARAVVRRGTRRVQQNAHRPEASSVDSDTEIATEFIPLIHGGDVALPEGGHIMRVELPRSALISFGLPMNMERAHQRVQADVVVGNDGLARAIRFVH